MNARRAENVRALLGAIQCEPRGLSPWCVLEDHGDKSRGSQGNLPAFYKLGFQYDPIAFGLPRELFVKALRAEGIAFDAGFKALHIGRSPSRFRAVGSLPNATAAHERCVMLHHPVLALSRVDVEQVADAIAKVYRDRDLFADRPS
jgi:dTDP-4-amino-4,6-dideoxygalactose transaminase